MHSIQNQFRLSLKALKVSISVILRPLNERLKTAKRTKNCLTENPINRKKIEISTYFQRLF